MSNLDLEKEVTRIKSIQNSIDILTKEMEEKKERIKKEFLKRNTEEIYTENYKITYKEYERKTFDSKKLKEYDRSVYDLFVKVNTYKKLLLN